MPYFWGQFAKKARHIGKNEDAILWRVRSKVFWEILVLVKHYKECSLSKPVRAAVLAHILSDPRLPAGPPNAVKHSRRKYHSVVTLSGYSVVKVPPTCPGISKAGRRDRRAFSESPDTVLLDGCPGFFEHPLPYASGFGIDGFVVRLSTSRPGVYRTSSRLTRPKNGMISQVFTLFLGFRDKKT